MSQPQLSQHGVPVPSEAAQDANFMGAWVEQLQEGLWRIHVVRNKFLQGQRENPGGEAWDGIRLQKLPKCLSQPAPGRAHFQTEDKRWHQAILIMGWGIAAAPACGRCQRPRSSRALFFTRCRHRAGASGQACSNCVLTGNNRDCGLHSGNSTLAPQNAVAGVGVAGAGAVTQATAPGPAQQQPVPVAPAVPDDYLPPPAPATHLVPPPSTFPPADILESFPRELPEEFSEGGLEDPCAPPLYPPLGPDPLGPRQLGQVRYPVYEASGWYPGVVPPTWMLEFDGRTPPGEGW